MIEKRVWMSKACHALTLETDIPAVFLLWERKISGVGIHFLTQEYTFGSQEYTFRNLFVGNRFLERERERD